MPRPAVYIPNGDHPKTINPSPALTTRSATNTTSVAYPTAYNATVHVMLDRRDVTRPDAAQHRRLP